MRWIVPAIVTTCMVVASACGGPQVPTHAGYKNEKAKPWKKPKVLQLDDKLEAKTDGELSYPGMTRARWFAIDLPANGELTLRLEITPPGEATNEDFDLALEVLDPGFRVISKSDLEESDAGELTKTKTLLDLVPGRYLVHLYLQGRMDSADYILRASFRRTAAAEVKSNFPAEVDFVPQLPMVAITDDTPAGYKPKSTTVVKVIPRGPRPPKEEKKPVVSAIGARIINVSVGAEGTRLTIGRGTESEPPVSDGMSGAITGIAGSSFKLQGCGPRACIGVVKVTPDQIKAAGGNVMIKP